MTKALLIALLAAGTALAAADPLARFSYSADLAQRMNAAYGASQTSLFVVDSARGRELANPRLLGAIQSLIRAFPGCGNRQLQFAYAYAATPESRFVAFSQNEMRAPECPTTTVVAVSIASNAVTVRSFPEIQPPPAP